MKMFKSAAYIMVAFFLLFATGVQAQTMSKKTVVDLAASNPDLSTFVAAVKAANLAGALSNEGPYTVFAPTNAAFEALPAGLLDALLLPRNQKVLVDILQFHVSEKKVDAAAVMAGIKADRSGRLIATTMNGNLTAMTKGGNVMLKGEQGRTATVTGTDMMADNGIIHTIDNVLLPEGVDAAGLLKATARSMKDRMKTSTGDMMEEGKATMKKTGADMADSADNMKNSAADNMKSSSMSLYSGDQYGQVENSIAKVATDNGNFNTLVGALGSTGLTQMFTQAGDYTVFAPTDAAFNALPDGTVSGLSNSQLKGVLTYHVLPYRMTASQLTTAIGKAKNYLSLPTIAGKTLVASVRDGKVVIMDDMGKTATVTTADVQTDNGLIHGIDAVLMPR